MDLIMKNGSITINGQVVAGRSISIRGGKVVVDGVAQEGFTEHVLNIVVQGDVESLNTTSGDVKVEGSVVTLRTVSGDVRCLDVTGHVQSVSGDIYTKNVGGSVKTLSGRVVQ